MTRLLCLIVFMAGAAFAEDAARLDKIEAAWRGWLDGHRVGASALAIAGDGAVLRELTRGGDVGAPAPLASLSKEITGACIRALVATGDLSYGERVARYLPGADPALTVSDLITHSGGVWPDSTQKTMWDWVNDADDKHRDVTDMALARPLNAAGSYRYNNENYAVLGALVEQATGAPYQEECAERVLAPLDIKSARRSPRYGPFLAWGGWEMSASDYARFVEAAFSAGDPKELPNAPVGGGAQYGLGAFFFEAEGLRITWHTGLLCFGSIDGAGAYFAQVTPGVTVAVTFEGCPGEGALASLDEALLTAMLR